MKHTYFYGHGVYFDGENFRYSDNDQLAHEGSELYSEINPISKRPCPQCHQLPTKEGHDACLGHLKGVRSACCGHGVEDGYIVWEHAPIEGEADWHILSIGKYRIHVKWKVNS